MNTISFDISSGEKGIVPALEAAKRFALENPNWKLILWSLESEQIDESSFPINVEFRKAKQKISGDVQIIESIRNENTTFYKAVEIVNNDEAHVVVSAAPSGPLSTLGYMKFKSLLPQVKVIFAPIFVDFHGRRKIMLDAGANINFDANLLNMYAIMGSEMSKALKMSSNPEIRLFNIGHEEGKGTQMLIDAHKLMKENKKINFKGNIEADKAFHEKYDVIVCDAISGNIFLKNTEAIYRELIKIMKQTKKTFRGKIALLLTKNTMVKDLKKMMNADESGGAIVLGLNKLLIKAHGVSDEREYFNSLTVAKLAYEANLIKAIKETLSNETENRDAENN